MQLKTVLRDVENGFSETIAGTTERRRQPRRSLRLSAITSSEACENEVTVLDISERGLLLEAWPGAMSIEDQIEIGLPDQDLVRARIAWQSGPFFGCEFDRTLSPAAISAALLRSDPEIRDDASAAPIIDDLAPGRIGIRLRPELNFSVALILSLALWCLIAVASSFFIW